MIIPKDIKIKYNLLEPYFGKVKEIIDNTILHYSLNNHFAYSSRIKEVDSLAEKIESGRYRDWDSIDDFVAAVIIIPSISYENDVITFLENSFKKVHIKKRGTTLKSPEVFRFDSTRFIGRLNKITIEEQINKINFEVQIRSAFEHAWSVTTHDLAYKSSTIDWKILRLASQLKSSVEQLDMITLSANKVKDNIQEHNWPETEIKTRICDFFNNAIINHLIPIELKPKDMSRFSENVFTIIKDSLSITNQRKWKKELNKIFDLLEKEFNLFKTSDFPMSLSLFQICFGMLLKLKLLDDNIINNHPFHKGELFDTIFPECKEFIINNFKI